MKTCHRSFPFWLIFLLCPWRLFGYDVTLISFIFSVYNFTIDLKYFVHCIYIVLYFSNIKVCAYECFNSNSLFFRGNVFVLTCSLARKKDEIYHPCFPLLISHYIGFSRYSLSIFGSKQCCPMHSYCGAIYIV